MHFLRYVLDLNLGKVYDEIRSAYVNNAGTLYILLAHYSKATPSERTGKLVRYSDLPGGYAYDIAFNQRAVSSVARIFGANPEMLIKAASTLNGVRLSYGDASVEILALPRIPLTYIVWSGHGELQPSATVLFDASASSYLPTEDLAGLGELTTLRLEHAYRYKKR